MPPTTNARSAVPSAREMVDTELLGLITEIHTTSKGTYGSPRVHHELRQRGVPVGRRRVARLMRQAGLEGRSKKRWRITTIADPDAEVARDRCDGMDYTVLADLDNDGVVVIWDIEIAPVE